MVFAILFVLFFSFCTDAAITFHCTSGVVSEQIQFQENDPQLKEPIIQSFIQFFTNIQALIVENQQQSQIVLNNKDFGNLKKINTFLSYNQDQYNALSVQQKIDQWCFLLEKIDFYCPGNLNNDLKRQRKDQKNLLRDYLCSLLKDCTYEHNKKLYNQYREGSRLLERILKHYVFFHKINCGDHDLFFSFITKHKFKSEPMRFGRLTKSFAWNKNTIYRCCRASSLFKEKTSMAVNNFCENYWQVFDENHPIANLDDFGEVYFKQVECLFFCFYDHENLTIRLVDKNKHQVIEEKSFFCIHASDHGYIIENEEKKLQCLFFDENKKKFFFVNSNNALTVEKIRKITDFNCVQAQYLDAFYQCVWKNKKPKFEEKKISFIGAINNFNITEIIEENSVLLCTVSVDDQDYCYSCDTHTKIKISSDITIERFFNLPEGSWFHGSNSSNDIVSTLTIAFSNQKTILKVPCDFTLFNIGKNYLYFTMMEKKGKYDFDVNKAYYLVPFEDMIDEFIDDRRDSKFYSLTKGQALFCGTMGTMFVLLLLYGGKKAYAKYQTKVLTKK